MMRKIDNPALRYAGLVFWVWKRYFRQSFFSFTKEDMNDWRQQGYCIALELYRKGYTEYNKKEILATAQKMWHKWLKEMGYIKPKHCKHYKKGIDHYIIERIEMMSNNQPDSNPLLLE